MKFEKKLFGSIDSTDIYLYTFHNDQNVSFSITNYGGIVTHLKAPDKNGKTADVVLGFDDLQQYLVGHPYFGALIGRFGNRVDYGKFTLGGKEYTLAQNNGTNHLHGGLKGFDKVIWEITDVIENKNESGIVLKYVSADGEEGYPGNVETIVKCYLNNDNELVFEYEAKTDKTTIINLTHHGYFNLNGMEDNVLEHSMQINADKITAINEKLIPTGELKNVTGTAFDFRNARKIGESIEEAGGYDHNYILNKQNNELSFAARVTDEKSGRVLEVFTTEPGMQFYSSNFLDGSFTGKDGIVYRKHHAFCLETQHFPDSPNQPEFPTTVLKPGETYYQKTTYKFSTL